MSQVRALPGAPADNTQETAALRTCESAARPAVKTQADTKHPTQTPRPHQTITNRPWAVYAHITTDTVGRPVFGPLVACSECTPTTAGHEPGCPNAGGPDA